MDIDLEFDNRAQDHRLRALFPAGIKTDSVISDGHFYANARPIYHPLGKDWLQPPVKTYPQQDFSLLQDGKIGFAVFNRGLVEFEAMRDPDGGAGLALTLLRSVGWLSRDDFPTRKFMNAGPTIATPDAQCLGKNKFHYAVVAFQGNWIDTGIKQMSQRWRVPPFVIQGVMDQSIPGTEGLVETWSNRIAVTAIKKHEERDTLIIRLYNLTADKSEETLRFGRDVKKGWIVNLLEEHGRELTPEKKRLIRIPMNPHAIVSLEIEF